MMAQNLINKENIPTSDNHPRKIHGKLLASNVLHSTTVAEVEEVLHFLRPVQILKYYYL